MKNDILERKNNLSIDVEPRTIRNSCAYTYSVIIPHWNCLEKLQRCLDSIPEREDIQVIVVDDCSTTCSLSDIEKEKKNWGDYRVLSTGQNRGGGVARNIGLDHASGHWVIFADADDYFTSSAFDVFDKYQNFDGDFIFFQCEFVIGGDGGTKEQLTFFDELSQKRSKCIAEYREKGEKMSLFYEVWEPWGKMFSRTFILLSKIRFAESLVMNDIYFSLQSVLRAERIETVLEEVYTYVFYPVSVSRISNLRYKNDALWQTLEVNRLLLENKKQILPLRYDIFFGGIATGVYSYSFFRFLMKLRLRRHPDDFRFREFEIRWLKGVIKKIIRNTILEKIRIFLKKF